MTDNNLAIWDRLGKTDPAQTKSFNRAGGFKGTAIKPIYTEHKMTEQFGPVGKGWGMGEPTFTTVPGSDGQVAVYCTVELWWREGEAIHGSVYGVGGDMVVVKQSNGLRTDDEAFKKAFTDAVGNAMKHLGMSADVHMGRFDDSKYVNELRAEMAGEPEPDATPTMPKAKARAPYAEMQAEIDACGSLEELATLWQSKAFQAEFRKLPADWQEQLTERKDLLKVELQKPIGNRPYIAPQFEGTAQ